VIKKRLKLKPGFAVVSLNRNCFQHRAGSQRSKNFFYDPLLFAKSTSKSGLKIKKNSLA